MRKLLLILNSAFATPALGLALTSCLVDYVQNNLKNTGVYPKFVKINDPSNITDEEKTQIKESVKNAVAEAVKGKNDKATEEDYSIVNYELIDAAKNLADLKKIELQVIANKDSKRIKGNTAKFALDIGTFPSLEDLGPRVGLQHIHVGDENNVTEQEISFIIDAIKKRVHQIILKKDNTLTYDDYTITNLDTLQSKKRASDINAIVFEVVPKSEKLSGKATFSINVHAHH